MNEPSPYPKPKPKAKPRPKPALKPANHAQGTHLPNQSASNLSDFLEMRRKRMHCCIYGINARKEDRISRKQTTRWARGLASPPPPRAPTLVCFTGLQIQTMTENPTVSEGLLALEGGGIWSPPNPSFGVVGCFSLLAQTLAWQVCTFSATQT